MVFKAKEQERERERERVQERKERKFKIKTILLFLLTEEKTRYAEEKKGTIAVLPRIYLLVFLEFIEQKLELGCFRFFIFKLNDKFEKKTTLIDFNFFMTSCRHMKPVVLSASTLTKHNFTFR